MHGRSGQAQQGVDIYGHNNGDCEYSGVQCKRYDTISETIIDDEIHNAKAFQPQLKHLIIATTAQRDAKIEKIVRQKDVENRQKRLFGISIVEWEDIVDILEQNPPLLNWYENSIGIGTPKTIKVFFSDGNEETIIRPRFKEKIYYHKNAYAAKNSNVPAHQYPVYPFMQQIEVVTGSINHSFVPIELRIDNIGMIEIKPISLIFIFPTNVTIDSTNEKYNMPHLSVSPNHTIIDTQTHQVHYKTDSLLPSRYGLLSKVYVRPDPSVKEFEIEWDFSSESFTNKGILKVRVEAELFTDYIASSKEPLPENTIEDFTENISNNRRVR